LVALVITKQLTIFSGNFNPHVRNDTGMECYDRQYGDANLNEDRKLALQPRAVNHEHISQHRFAHVHLVQRFIGSTVIVYFCIVSVDLF